jgi:hypothetical protein
MEKDKLDGTTTVSAKGVFTNTTEDQQVIATIDKALADYSAKKKKSSWLSLSILAYVAFKLILSVEKVGRNNPDMLNNPSYWIMIVSIGIVAYIIYTKVKKKF